jgi:hypothetical protein
MRKFLIAALLAAGPSFAGNLVLKNGSGNELRLYDTPCSHGETLGILKEEWRTRFKNARVLNSKGFILMYGCWVEQEGSAVVILSDGAAIQLPLSAFTDPMI